MRRASIDKINSRYRGGSTVSPPSTFLRASGVRNVTTVAPVLAPQLVQPTYISQAPAIVTAGPISTIGRGTTYTGAQVFGSTVAPVVSSVYSPHVGMNTVVRSSRVGVTGLRTSTVVSPPIYEAIEHPAVYTPVTSPPTVYEIRTPIVEVTPPTTVVTEVATTRPVAVAPRPLCPWWCWPLLCLIPLLLLLSVLGYIFRKDLGFEDNKEQVKEEFVEEKKLTCKEGTFLKNGKCLSCPKGTNWNGKSCIKKVVEKKVTRETETVSTGNKDQEAGTENKPEGEGKTEVETTTKTKTKTNGDAESTEGVAAPPADDAASGNATPPEGDAKTEEPAADAAPAEGDAKTEESSANAAPAEGQEPAQESGDAPASHKFRAHLRKTMW